jgi:N-acetyltransferase 10
VDDASFGTRLTPLQEELNLPVNQALALFVKSIRKISKRLMDIQKSALEAGLPSAPTADGNGDQRSVKAAEALKKMKPVDVTIDDELREAGNEVTREIKGKAEGDDKLFGSLKVRLTFPTTGSCTALLIDGLADDPLPSSHPLHRRRFHCRYAIDTDSADWTVAESQISKAGHGGSTVVSVKSLGDKKRKLDEVSIDGGDEKRRKGQGRQEDKEEYEEGKEVALVVW